MPRHSSSRTRANHAIQGQTRPQRLQLNHTALMWHYRILAMRLGNNQHWQRLLCSHKPKAAPQIQYLSNKRNDARWFTICRVDGCPHRGQCQYITAALSSEELQDFHSQYPSRGRRRALKDGIFDDTEYVPEVEEYWESYEYAWARARLTLKERGLPTQGVDIDEYIHSGTPDMSVCESDSKGCSEEDLCDSEADADLN